MEHVVLAEFLGLEFACFVESLYGVLYKTSWRAHL